MLGDTELWFQSLVHSLEDFSWQMVIAAISVMSTLEAYGV